MALGGVNPVAVIPYDAIGIPYRRCAVIIENREMYGKFSLFGIQRNEGIHIDRDGMPALDRLNMGNVNGG